MQDGLIFITGLSGSGKSTLSKELIKQIKIQYNIRAISLDGDSLRECVGNIDYSKSGRENMAMYYVRTAKMLVDQGFLVVLSTISMFNKVRQFNRDNIKNYIEIYLDVSKDILAKRDSKGFYKNKTINMAGINQEIELPTQSDLIFYNNYDIQEAIAQILVIYKDKN